MTNYGFEPRMSFDLIDCDGTARERVAKRLVTNITDKMQNIWDHAKAQLTKARDSQQRQANKTRTLAPDYKVGDMVWLSTKNINTTRPSRKLDHKWLGPYSIKRVMPGACELDLPQSMKIHSTFHTSLLRPVADDPLPGQIPLPPPPVMTEDEDDEWELDDILDSRRYRGRLQYKVAWTGHPPDPTWYPATNFSNAQETVDEYHRKYPSKPGPVQSTPAQIALLISHNPQDKLDSRCD